MWTDWFWIVVGLTLLIVGADLLVRGSVWIALVLGMSKLMVGLTLVAFGTSAPELVVSLQGALQGGYGLATGAVLGSNITNAGLIVGAAALIMPITMTPRAVHYELGFTITAGVLPLLPIVFAWDRIGREYGAVLILFVTVFTWSLIARNQRDARRAKDGRSPDPVALPLGEEALVDVPVRKDAAAFAIHALWILLGLAGLYFGGEWLVGGASAVASDLGMSDMLIGSTVVAIGTSLPELATTVVAARKGHPEMGLGNVLGSNIFNVGMVLGLTAVVAPLPITWETEGFSAVVGLGLVVFLWLSMHRTHGVGRIAGAILLLGFVGYITASVMAEVGR